MVKKILVVLHGSIGDVTRAIPLVNLLRRGFPDARITWSVEPVCLPLVENHPAVDRVIVFQRKLWWKKLAPFLRQVRAGQFDLVLDLQRHLKSGLISWWSRAGYRLGFHRSDSKEGNWIFNNRHIPPAGDQVSKLFHYLKFAEFLGISSHPIEWQFPLSPEEQERVSGRVAAIGRSFAVFYIGGRWESKRWFPHQTAQSAAEVHRRFNLSIVLLGGREDLAFAREVEGFQLGPMVNWVGETSLRETVGILSRALVAVGPDTGLMHLAAAVGTPVVSLWGATSPLRTGPYGYGELVIQGKAHCSPCYLRRCPISRICMQSIDIVEVVERVGRALTVNGGVNGPEN